MDKEKEIEEMRKSIHYALRELENAEQLEQAIAEKLTSDGYRKADEVRKETAKEILKEFWKIQWGQSELDNVCIRLAEKYGVEVDE